MAVRQALVRRLGLVFKSHRSIFGWLGSKGPTALQQQHKYHVLDGQAPNGDIPYCLVMRKLVLLRTSKTNKYSVCQKEKLGKVLFQLEMVNFIPLGSWDPADKAGWKASQVADLRHGRLLFGHFMGWPAEPTEKESCSCGPKPKYIFPLTQRHTVVEMEQCEETKYWGTVWFSSICP